MSNLTAIAQRLCGALALVLMTGTAAAGQSIAEWTERGFAHISFGNQPGSRTETVAGGFDLYEEVATFGADLRTEGSTIFDIMGGHRVWRNVAVALGYSTYSDSVGTVVTATIPDWLFTDTFYEQARGVGDLDHRERAVHLSAAYMLPVTDLPYVNRLDVLVFGGPSFFSLRKDVVSGIVVPQGTSELADVLVNGVTGSATGAHIGVDVSYRITSYRQLQAIGVGFFLRGSSGSVDVPEVQGGQVEVGGFNYGFGARFRF